MELTSITKDNSNKVSQWNDLDAHYDVKASGNSRPTYAENIIGGKYPAIDFTGSNIGLIADVKYSQVGNQPFTWIAALQPTATGWLNIFTTNDAPWSDLNSGVWNYHPISMVTLCLYINFFKIVLFFFLFSNYTKSKFLQKMVFPQAINKNSFYFIFFRAGSEEKENKFFIEKGRGIIVLQIT